MASPDFSTRQLPCTACRAFSGSSLGDERCALPSRSTQKVGQFLFAVVDHNFPSVIANPTALDHFPATNPLFSPSTSCVALAVKKLALTHTSNFSRSAISLGGISTVCHSPSPSGSAPADETRSFTSGF